MPFFNGKPFYRALRGHLQIYILNEENEGKCEN
jgi:hypothetical protein